jgi:tRNA-binding protein
MITIEDFEKVDIRAGRIIDAEVFPEAKKPAYKLTIDFGPEIGIKKSSAQITQRYFPEDLKNRAVLAVVNLPPRDVAGFASEVLVLGMHNEEKEVVLVSPDSLVPVGSRLCSILAAPFYALYHAREFFNSAMFAMPTS